MEGEVLLSGTVGGGGYVSVYIRVGILLGRVILLGVGN